MQALVGSSDPRLRDVAEVATNLIAVPQLQRLERIASALGVTVGEVQRELVRGRALADAAAHYDPGLYTGSAQLLIHSGESPLWPSMAADMQTYWHDICVVGVDIAYVPGDHFTCRDLVTLDQIGFPEEEK